MLHRGSGPGLVAPSKFRRRFGGFNCESQAKLQIVSQPVYDDVDNRGKWPYCIFSTCQRCVLIFNKKKKKAQTCFYAAIVNTCDVN